MEVIAHRFTVFSGLLQSLTWKYCKRTHDISSFDLSLPHDAIMSLWGPRDVVNFAFLCMNENDYLRLGPELLMDGSFNPTQSIRSTSNPWIGLRRYYC